MIIINFLRIFKLNFFQNIQISLIRSQKEKRVRKKKFAERLKCMLSEKAIKK